MALRIGVLSGHLRKIGLDLAVTGGIHARDYIRHADSVHENLTAAIATVGDRSAARRVRVAGRGIDAVLVSTAAGPELLDDADSILRVLRLPNLTDDKRSKMEILADSAH